MLNAAGSIASLVSLVVALITLWLVRGIKRDYASRIVGRRLLDELRERNENLRLAVEQRRLADARRELGMIDAALERMKSLVDRQAKRRIAALRKDTRQAQAISDSTTLKVAPRIERDLDAVLVSVRYALEFAQWQRTTS